MRVVVTSKQLGHRLGVPRRSANGAAGVFSAAPEALSFEQYFFPECGARIGKTAPTSFFRLPVPQPAGYWAGTLAHPVRSVFKLQVFDISLTTIERNPVTLVLGI